LKFLLQVGGLDWGSVLRQFVQQPVAAGIGQGHGVPRPREGSGTEPPYQSSRGLEEKTRKPGGKRGPFELKILMGDRVDKKDGEIYVTRSQALVELSREVKKKRQKTYKPKTDLGNGPYTLSGRSRFDPGKTGHRLHSSQTPQVTLKKLAEGKRGGKT